MLDDEAPARLGESFGIAGRARERRQQRLDEFGNDHRGWAHAVVTDAAAGIAQVEPLARGEQQIQEQIPIVEAALAIAGARRRRCQVELTRPGGGREGAVIETEDADEAERQIAQTAHRGEGDRAGGYAAARGVIEQRFEPGAQHRERHRHREAAAAHVLVEFAQRGAHVGDIVDVVVRRCQERVQHVEQRRMPCLRQTGFAQLCT